MEASHQRTGGMTKKLDTPTPHTAASVAEIVRKNFEPRDAEEVLNALRPFHGQVITIRLLDKLPGGRVEWRIQRQLGRVELKNRAFLKDSRTGLSLTLAKAGSERLDADRLERENPEYFARRRERNALREQALTNAALLERVALLFSEIEELNQKRAVALRQFAVFVQPGEPLHPDRLELQRAITREEREQQHEHG